MALEYGVGVKGVYGGGCKRGWCIVKYVYGEYGVGVKVEYWYVPIKTSIPLRK